MRPANEGDDLKVPHKYVDGHYVPLTEQEISEQKATMTPEPEPDRE